MFWITGCSRISFFLAPHLSVLSPMVVRTTVISSYVFSLFPHPIPYPSYSYWVPTQNKAFRFRFFMITLRVLIESGYVPQCASLYVKRPSLYKELQGHPEPSQMASPFPKLVHRYNESTSLRFAGVISRAWPWPLICASVEIITLRKFRYICKRRSVVIKRTAAYLVLGVESYDRSFVGTHDCLAGSNDSVVCLGRQLVRQ